MTDWIICKFDEKIVSSEEGWNFIANLLLNPNDGHLQKPQNKILLVIPGLEGDDEKLSNLVQEAKSVKGIPHLSHISDIQTNDSKNFNYISTDQTPIVQVGSSRNNHYSQSGSIVMSWGKHEEYEDSIQDGYNSWKQRILSFWETLGFDLQILSSYESNNTFSSPQSSKILSSKDKNDNDSSIDNDIQSDESIFISIIRYFQQMERLILGIALTKETSTTLHSKILTISSEILSRIGVWYLNEKIFKKNQTFQNLKAQFFDCKSFFSIIEQSIPCPGNTTHSHYQLETTQNIPIFDSNFHSYFENMNSRLVITQGNIMSSQNSNTSIFQRNGSDYAYLAAKLGVKCVEYWKSGFGIFTCHIPANSPPPSSHIVKQLTYSEAIEIAANNPSIIHPYNIKILENNGIDLHLKSMLLYNKCNYGTLIKKTTDNISSIVKTILLRTSIILISIDSLLMWQQAGFLSEIFNIFRKYSLSIDLITTSEANVTVTLDTTSETMDSTFLEKVLLEIKNLNCKVQTKGPCAAISLIGENIRSIWQRMGSILQNTGDYTIHLISQSASNVNITFIVDQSQAQGFIQSIHHNLFSGVAVGEVIGKTWKELIHPSESSPNNFVSGPHVWWMKKRQELQMIGQEETPVYVYDEETLIQNVNQLLSMKSVDLIFYAMKANNHPKILQLFESRGIGFECVSIDEVDYILSLFPSLHRKRILFTPNFAPHKEYKKGLELGIHVTLDNIYIIETWGSTFKGKEVFIRIDPGEGQGHHDKVKTAGKQSKFGIPLSDINRLHQLCTENEIKVVGLHAHVGSGILTEPETWKKTGSYLAKICEIFTDVEMIDLGGGLGVPQKPTDPELHIQSVENNLQLIKKPRENIKIMIEPGRYLVATAGVLLTKVTQIKSKGEHIYIGVDAGMHTLIRPALYGSYHEIVNLSRIDEEYTWNNVDVVGTICETGDILGSKRTFPHTKSDDIFLISTAGAYGIVMSSQYNMRKLAKQIFLEKK